MSSIMSYRSNPNNTPKSKEPRTRMVFYFILVVMESVFIGSCVAYGFVHEKDRMDRDQNFLGLLVTSVSVVLTSILCFFSSSAGVDLDRKIVDKNNQFLHYFDDEYFNSKKKKSLDELVCESGMHFIPLASDDERTPLNIQDDEKIVIISKVPDFAFPQGKRPYCHLLFVVRWLTMSSFLLTFGLLSYAVIVDNVVHPCDIPKD